LKNIHEPVAMQDFDRRRQFPTVSPELHMSCPLISISLLSEGTAQGRKTPAPDLDEPFVAGLGESSHEKSPSCIRIASGRILQCCEAFRSSRMSLR
jgi:hypothetical protein